MTNNSISALFAGTSYKTKPQMEEGFNLCTFADLRPAYSTRINTETQEEEQILTAFWVSTEEFADIRVWVNGAELLNPNVNWNLANLFAQLEIEIPTDEAIKNAKGHAMFCVKESKEPAPGYEKGFVNYYFQQK